jgi:hypothetical protein
MSIDWATYETVLRDLRSQRANIDKAISAIEALRPVETKAPTPEAKGESPAPVVAKSPTFALVGQMKWTIIGAAMKVLRDAAGKPLHVSEILKRVQAMGIVLNSTDPANMLGTMLNRRRKLKGDVIRADKGTWAAMII